MIVPPILFGLNIFWWGMRAAAMMLSRSLAVRAYAVCLPPFHPCTWSHSNIRGWLCRFVKICKGFWKIVCEMLSQPSEPGVGGQTQPLEHFHMLLPLPQGTPGSSWPAGAAISRVCAAVDDYGSGGAG